ncbi:MAG: cation diffusion facilitator family transporter [Caulobacteraceae bacterium]
MTEATHNFCKSEDGDDRDRDAGEHAGHSHAPDSFGTGFVVGAALNLAFVIGEAAVGVASQSLALLADAGHNLGDVLALALAFVAQRLSQRAPSGRYTYGLRGSSILAALANAVALLLVTGAIGWQAVQRLVHPGRPGGLSIIIVALVGVGVNGASAALFAKGRKSDLNLRAAFSHMAADALVALGVAIAGALILLTGRAWIDPAASLIVCVFIVAATWNVLKEALELSLHAVPASVDSEAVRDYLRRLPGVAEVHDLHIWGMSTTETALTAHLVRPGAALDDELLRQACDDLRARFRIHHATFQIEAGQGRDACDLAAEEVV